MQTATLSEFCRIVKKVSEKRTKRSRALRTWAKTMESEKILGGATEESLGIEEAVCMKSRFGTGETLPVTASLR